MRKPVKACLRVISNLRANLAHGRKRLAGDLVRRASALDSPYPNYVPVLKHLEAELEALHRELTGAETAYDVARPALAHFRSLRDELACRLRAFAGSVVRALRAHPGLDRGTVPGPPPQSPDALAASLNDLLALLRRLGDNPPPPVFGIHMDTDLLIAELEPGLRQLRACRKALIEAEANVTYTRARADEVFARARSVSSWIGRVAENLMLLAGEASVERRRASAP